MTKNFPIQLLAVALCFALFGCSSGFETEGDDTLVEQCFVNASAIQNNKLSKASPLNTDKMHIQNREKFTAGEELVVLVDNACASGSEGGMNQLILEGQKIYMDLALQAYPFKVSADTTMEQMRERINNDDCIVGMGENAKLSATAIPDDTDFANQNHLANLRAADAWDIFYDAENGIAAAQETVIAIIDSGIDYTHPDLVNQMWTDADGNFGRDFVNNDDLPLDDNSHGTHVAGLVAAETNNNLGVAGVIGVSAKLMAVKSLDAIGEGSIANVINGINYAVAQGADVINLSLGSRGEFPLLEEALLMAVQSGVTVVVAAGNNGEEVADDNFFSPIGYAKDVDGMIGVAATDSDDRSMAIFSNYSPTYVEIAAPGTRGILSTLPGEAYGAEEGTSMACPIVAGAVALTYSLLETRGRQLSPAIVEELLLSGSVNEIAINGLVLNNKHLDLLSLGEYLEDLFVNDTPPLIVQQPRSVTTINGQAVNLEVRVSDELFVSYQWQKDGVDLEDATTSTYSIESTTDDDSGEYQVKINQLGIETISQAAVVTSREACQ